MPEPATAPPLVWRIPAWQPALLVLLATGLLALSLYAELSVGGVLMTTVIGVAALVGAGLALRLQLVADDSGIWVRRILAETLIPWDDVTDVEVEVGRRNATTVRITRQNTTFVDVPPSLLLPTLPTNVRTVRAIMGRAAAQLMERARAHQHVS